MSQDTESQVGGSGELAICSNPDHARSDSALIRRAIRLGWDIPKRVRDASVVAMADVVNTPTKTIMTDEGPIEVSNAANQIGAVRALVAMDAVDQADFWNHDKNERLDAGKATERLAVDPVILRQPIKPE